MLKRRIGRRQLMQSSGALIGATVGGTPCVGQATANALLSLMKDPFVIRSHHYPKMYLSPNPYLTHRQRMTCDLVQVQSNRGFVEAAFRARQGWSDPHLVSIESFSIPGFFLRHNKLALTFGPAGIDRGG